MPNMPTETWTVKRVLDWTVGYLDRKGDERPRLSAEWLLCAVTGLSRVEVYTNFDRPLDVDELAAMHEGVARRGRGEPLQYVTGEMPFRHIIMRCEEGVLIPRPETEVLVDACLEVIRDVEAPRVLEVGTGTGCIALSLATECPGTRVIATDVSPRAVALAKRNRDALGLAGVVDIVACDLAAAVPEALWGTFDLLVSNPPYIPTAVLESEVPAEVKDHEPHLALDGGPDGLDVFRRLLELAPIMLRPQAVFACELSEDNVGAAADLCRAADGWASAEVLDDLTGRPRVLVARRSKE